MLALLAALVFTVSAAAAPGQAPSMPPATPDQEGFIRHWLVLGPLAIEGDAGTTEIDREFFPGEGRLRPLAEAPQQVGPWWYTWKAHQTTDFYVDFLELFGHLLSERVAAYAVTYVTAPSEMRVTLAMGSNDQGKVWLNGEAVATATEARGLERDATRAPVTLRQGRNVLVFKVINEVNNWQGCVRFLQGTIPVPDLIVSLTAQ